MTALQCLDDGPRRTAQLLTGRRPRQSWRRTVQAGRSQPLKQVAALDIGKASLVACLRVPDETRPGRRRQEVRTFATSPAVIT